MLHEQVQLCVCCQVCWLGCCSCPPTSHWLQGAQIECAHWDEPACRVAAVSCTLGWCCGGIAGQIKFCTHHQLRMDNVPCRYVGPPCSRYLSSKVHGTASWIKEHLSWKLPSEINQYATVGLVPIRMWDFCLLQFCFFPHLAAADRQLSLDSWHSLLEYVLPARLKFDAYKCKETVNLLHSFIYRA